MLKILGKWEGPMEVERHKGHQLMSQKEKGRKRDIQNNAKNEVKASHMLEKFWLRRVIIILLC